jgi:LuxR family maltose regulon positive regulatory protein
VTALLPTKLYLPSAPAGFVARPQLQRKLDEVLTHRLALISAPAGTGKTTLVCDWAQMAIKNGKALGWLSLDGSDNEPGRFLDYLIACLEEAGLVIDSVEITRGTGEPEQVGKVIGAIVRSAVALKRALILVLDDYHLIQNKAIHALLEDLIEHAPPCLHFIILTRSDPPFELARLRVRGQLLELRMDQLRFSAQETAAFLNLAAGVQLPENEVSALNARTEGWIAGLQMAAISLRGHADVSSFVTAFTASNRFVFDYLLEQVLNRQPAEVRAFLLKTSVLERLTAPLCDAVTDSEYSARRMFEILEKENLFLIPLDDERGWYRYHHLFSSLLNLLLEQAHPGLSKELHRRACHWYESQGMLPEALQHALSTGDMKLAAQIVSTNVLVLIENDEITPTLQKIDSVPFEELIAQPWLGIARAWALGVEQIPKSQQALDAAEQSTENILDEVERQRLKGHIAAARAFLYSAQGDAVNTFAAASQANELLPLDETSVRTMNLITWGDRLVAINNIPEALAILEQALVLAFKIKKPHMAMIVMGSLATAHLFAGRFHAVQRVCLDALALAEDYHRRHQNSLSASAEIYPLLARVLAEWGEYEQSIQLARKGLALSRHWGRVSLEVRCLDYLGRALICGNEWEQGREVLQLADSIALKNSPTAWETSACFILDSLMDYESPDPRIIADQRWRLQESGINIPLLMKARLMLKDNQPDEALAKLDLALVELNGQPSFDIVRIYAMRALAYQAKGETKLALHWLQQALELGEPENRIASFVREGSAMEKLLRIAKTKALAPKFVNRLLASFEARHKHKLQPVPMTQALIEPLSERELEVLQHLNSYLSTPEIADLLVVSANTVRTHIKNIYGKLGVHGRSGAVQRARELNLLT